MAASHSLRQQNKTNYRFFRKRRDSEEENIFIDLNRDAAEVAQEILFNIVNQDVNGNKKLGYLNLFVKLCIKHGSSENFGFSNRDLFCCLRMAFLHEMCEVRAAGLRACRYLLHDGDSLRMFYQMHLPLFVSRSLDILLDNRVERIQALRLIRKALCINPIEFPRAFTSCLVAIVNEGVQEREMLRPCLSTLAQLTMLNPGASIDANGINALMKSILESSHPQTSEAILSVILFLINHPTTRSLVKDGFGLERLLAPFTDCHYHYPSTVQEMIPGDDREIRDPNLSACKTALVCTLHSWAGLTYLCRDDCSHLHSLVEMLYLPYSELRKNILDLLYQIFDISIPEWTDDFTVALSSADPSAMKNSWQLYEDYVVAEGIDILPYSSNDRMNIVQNYYAILLLVFIQCGVLEALAKVIVSGEINLAVRATVFLGEFICIANRLLPVECSHLSNCLPTLISSAASFENVREQNQAAGALTCLFRIHELKKKVAIPRSLVLANILRVCNPEREKKGFFAGTLSRNKLRQFLKKEMGDGTDQSLKDSQVFSKEFSDWDWDLIDGVLKNPSDALRRLDDANCKIFIRKLIHFFKPTSKEYSEMEIDNENGQQITITGCHFMEFLLEIEEIKTQEYLVDLLCDINNSLVQVTSNSNSGSVILSPIKLLHTYSQMYFLFIGKISSTQKGCKFLNKCDIFQSLLHLVSVTNQDIYIKLVVSSLDYTKEGFSRAILNKVLTGTEETTRLYATNFLRVLLRSGLPDFHKWAVEVLVTQLHDINRNVSLAAIDILDEACNITANLEALISLKPALLHMGDKGLLLLLRFLSISSGFQFLRDTRFLDYELKMNRQQVFHLKYVKIIEDLLNEAFTQHRRSDDGSYGRRTSDVSRSLRYVYLPPHIVGQLVQHEEGLKFLEQHIFLSELYGIIRFPDFSSEASVLHLKASLWAVGHLGSYKLGLNLLLKENVIPCIVNLAAEAPVLAVRGTCYFVLGLLGSTPEGIEVVKDYGWEGVQRNHKEKWPLVKEELFEELTKSVRTSTWSFSSMSSDGQTGALPMNLSFVMQSSQPELSENRSQGSFNSIGETSMDSIKETLGIPIKSPSNDARQRSSSDCQMERTDGSLPEIMESSSWDALNSTFLYTPPNYNQYVKRRSISSFEVDKKLFVLPSDNSSEDSFHLSDRLTKPSLSSCSLGNSKDVSKTSIATSRSSEEYTERPSLLKQLSHTQAARLSPSEESCPLLLTSAQDAHGYATLKDIHRRRVNSLSFHDGSDVGVAVVVRHMKTQSLDISSSASFHLHTAQNVSLNPDADDSKASQSSQNESSGQSLDVRYIGLCLPADLKFIFSVPNLCRSNAFTPVNDNDKGFSESNNEGSQDCLEKIFEFHTDKSCILNHSFSSKRDRLHVIIDEENEENPSSHSESSIKCEQIVPLERTNSLRTQLRLKENNLNNRLLICKEAMRYVTNLCSSVAIKASEQGLLNLKQKFPNAFQDICLYTEISYYMANYNFRLPARRFMQELFLDASFEQLHYEAEAVIGMASATKLGGGDAS